MLGVVGPLDEALGCKSVREDIVEGGDGAEDQGCQDVLEDITPSSALPQLINCQLSANLAEVQSLVYLVTWLVWHVAFSFVTKTFQLAALQWNSSAWKSPSPW